MSSPNRRCAFAAAAIAAALTLGACGTSSNTTTDNTKPAAAKTTATKLSITISDAGKGRFRTQAPASIRGGLVQIEFHNAGKQPHEAQLLRLDGGHTAAEAIKTLGSDSGKTPEWIHGAGGVGTIAPGATGQTTINLPAGQYAVADTGGDNGPPPATKGALATFTVTSGPTGPLPAHDATIVAATRGMDMYEFKVSGLLKAGPNRILFENRSKGELHHVVAVPLQPGKTLADVKAALAEQGKPSGPPPVDFSKETATSVIDGGTSEVTTLNLATPGKWVLLCFVTDRDGGKPHFMEGMLKVVDVK